MAGDKIAANVQYYYENPASGRSPNFVANILSSLSQAILGGPASSLVKDNAENLGRINWTVYGKIASISKLSGGIAYGYDAGGQRIKKTFDRGGTAGSITTYYVRDAQGNTMGVYSNDQPGGAQTYSWQEQHLYGSSRLGMVTPNLTITGGQPLGNDSYLATNDPIANGIAGKRLYELSNHLGNVLATISDKKIPVANGATIDHYEADLVAANDYYPFGMQMPGRKFSQAGGGYRYGFNGKENDNEVKGEGNQQDYGMRIYDTRLGRFLSVDPLTPKYPELTPYQFSSNRPIDGVDLDGLEHRYYALINDNGQEKLRLIGKEDIVLPTFWGGNITANRFGLDYVLGKDKQWRIIPDNYKNKTFTIWETYKFPTKKQLDAEVNLLTQLGKDAEAAVAVANLIDGVKNIYQWFKRPRGGKMTELETREFYDRHEIPSNSTMKKIEYGNKQGPAAQMPTDAHNLTGSHPRMPGNREFRAAELELLQKGKYDDVWKMLENDFNRSLNQAGYNKNEFSGALYEARKVFYNEVVPFLKEAAKQK